MTWKKRRAKKVCKENCERELRGISEAETRDKDTYMNGGLFVSWRSAVNEASARRTDIARTLYNTPSHLKLPHPYPRQ